MLVLSRKIGETIHVGKDIVIEVRRMAGNRVSLAIGAPKSVRILRGELKAAAEAFEESETAEIPTETTVLTHHHVTSTDTINEPHALG